MAYTASTLITRACYLSKVVSRRLQNPSGDQITDGLFLLNALLDVKSADTNLIPYYKQYDNNFVVGQEKYFIPGLLAVQTATFFIGTIRYPMNRLERVDYFGTGRVENINSLPFSYHVERTFDSLTDTTGSNLYVYYFPDQTYAYQIWGKFGLNNVTLNTDLSTVYDSFYIEYLRYSLADYICEYNGVSFAPQSAMRLKILESKLQMISPPDLSVQKISTLQNSYVMNYAQANIGKGWTP